MSEVASFRINKYMSRTRFESIIFLCYTDQKYVGYCDGFFHVRRIEEAWNINMAEEFNTSRINVLDEIIMDWF